MTPTDIAALGGLATGVLAFLGVVYALGYKFGKIETKVSFLWGIAMEESVRRQAARGNLRRNSPIELTGQHRDIFAAETDPQVDSALRRLAQHRRLPREQAEIAYLVIRQLTFDVVAERAETLDVSMHDYLAFCVARVFRLHSEKSS